MSFKLRLSIRDAEPPVLRTVTVPSGTTLYDAADIFVTAMGWSGGRYHRFAVDDDYATTEMEKMATIDDIFGEKTEFVYDPAHPWVVDCVSLEETDDGAPMVLEHEGDCPPQIFCGVEDYNHILRSAADPKDPYHGNAMAWMRTVEPYDMAAVNSRMARGDMAPQAYDFTKLSADSVSVLMDKMVEGKDVVNVRSMVFRCPECGCRCDGRVDFDRLPSNVRGTNRRPVAVACPECGRLSVLYMKNDGYRTGYTADSDSRCMSCLDDLYDLKNSPRTEGTAAEKAMAECRLAEAHVRHNSRNDDLDALLAAYRGLDGSETEARCGCLRALAALDMGRGRIGKDLYEDAYALREGFKGALSSVALMAATDIHPEDREWLTSRAVELVESDRDSPLADRLIACYRLIDSAESAGDTGTVARAVSWLEPFTDEILSADEPTSSEWSAYCRFLEFLVTYLEWAGMKDEAGKALKTATSRLVDDWTEKIPVSVRNVVAFRRALLFVTDDGDTGQALDDLRSVRDSLVTNEDNGPITISRVMMSLILMRRLAPTDMKCIQEFVQVFTVVTSGKSWLPKAYADRIFELFTNASVMRGFGPKMLQGELKKLGLDIKIEGTEPFDPEDLWKFPLPELT